MRSVSFFRKVLIGLFFAARVFADDQPFGGQPDDHEIKVPKLQELIRKFGILTRGSAEARTRGVGDFRVYELELVAVPVGMVMTKNGEFSDDDDLLPSRRPIRESRLMFLPITVVGQLDQNGEERFAISKVEVPFVAIEAINKPWGTELFSVYGMGMRYEKHDLDLGSSSTMVFIGAKLKQVFDLTSDGFLRLVLKGSFSAGSGRPSMEDRIRYAQRRGGADFAGEFYGEVGLMLKRKVSFTATGQTRINFAGKKTDIGLTNSQIDERVLGGTIEWKPLNQLSVSLRLSNDHYDLKTFTATERTDKHVDTVNWTKSGLGVNAGIKFIW